MARKTKLPRKSVAKRRAVKPPKTKRAAAPRKKIVRRKKAIAKKSESTLKRIENAILVGAAEADDIAISLGLLAASQPPRRKKSR
ncbi:MAG: hypothetical protein ABSD21_10165 [Rhizomicrobium sp.]